MVIFDDVVVPWERVFLMNDVDLARERGAAIDRIAVIAQREQPPTG